MFDFYYDKLKKQYVNEDHISDYIISRNLGITQQKVKNLRIKRYLKGECEIDWRNRLKNILNNARYDKETKKIRLNIQDPVLMLEIKNFIEDKGGYVESQLNGKILQIRIEYFLDLAIDEDKDRKAIKEALKQTKKEYEKDLKIDIERDSIGKTLIDNGIKVIDVVNVISSGNVAGDLLRIFVDFVKDNCIFEDKSKS